MTAMPRPGTLQPAVFHLHQIAALAKRRLSVLAQGRDPGLLARLDAAIALLDECPARLGYQHLPPDVGAMAYADPRFAPLLTARLLSAVVARHAARPLPDALLPELHRQAARILQVEASAPDDAFCKDLSICQLRSYPCVAQVVEESGGVPARALTSGGMRQAARLAGYLARTGLRRRPYLEIHTHTPMLADFTPEGWDRCYLLVAELLRQRPEFLGMVGGSWFYDPALGEISPRLRYLVETPIGGGAFRLRLGCSRADVELATATSATRRKLVEQGLYRPTRWLLVWPRPALLAWAARRAGAAA